MREGKDIIRIEGDRGVDKNLLSGLADINARLAALGFRGPSGYSIAPALGGDVIKHRPVRPAPSGNATASFTTHRTNRADARGRSMPDIQLPGSMGCDCVGSMRIGGGAELKELTDSFWNFYLDPAE